MSTMRLGDILIQNLFLKQTDVTISISIVFSVAHLVVSPQYICLSNDFQSPWTLDRTFADKKRHIFKSVVLVLFFFPTLQ